MLSKLLEHCTWEGFVKYQLSNSYKSFELCALSVSANQYSDAVLHRKFHVSYKNGEYCQPQDIDPSNKAPELLLGSDELTPAADMFSVGCIFGEMLLMRRLFSSSKEIVSIFRYETSCMYTLFLVKFHFFSLCTYCVFTCVELHSIAHSIIKWISVTSSWWPLTVVYISVTCLFPFVSDVCMSHSNSNSLESNSIISNKHRLLSSLIPSFLFIASRYL